MNILIGIDSMIIVIQNAKSHGKALKPRIHLLNYPQIHSTSDPAMWPNICTSRSVRMVRWVKASTHHDNKLRKSNHIKRVQ